MGVVQSTYNEPAGTPVTLSLTLPSSGTNGNMLVAIIMTANTTATITGTAGFTALTQFNCAIGRGRIFWRKIDAGQNSFTGTFSVGSSRASGFLVEWSGSVPINPVLNIDQGQYNSTASLTITGPTSTAANGADGELYVAAGFIETYITNTLSNTQINGSSPDFTLDRINFSSAVYNFNGPSTVQFTSHVDVDATRSFVIGASWRWGDQTADPSTPVPALVTSVKTPTTAITAQNVLPSTIVLTTSLFTPSFAIGRVVFPSTVALLESVLAPGTGAAPVPLLGSMAFQLPADLDYVGPGHDGLGIQNLPMNLGFSIPEHPIRFGLRFDHKLTRVIQRSRPR